MKASELISKLQKNIQEHGDLYVFYYDADVGYLVNIDDVSFIKKDEEFFKLIPKDEPY